MIIQKSLEEGACLCRRSNLLWITFPGGEGGHSVQSADEQDPTCWLQNAMQLYFYSQFLRVGLRIGLTVIYVFIFVRVWKHDFYACGSLGIEYVHSSQFSPLYSCRHLANDMTTFRTFRRRLISEVFFIADSTNGRVYATMLRLSSVVVVVCDVMYCG